mgnify:CR=1 FL=1
MPDIPDRLRVKTRPVFFINAVEKFARIGLEEMSHIRNTEFFKKGEDHMKKWKAILFGTLLTMSLCTFTACGTDVNNADETVDENDKDVKDKNDASKNEAAENAADDDGVMDNDGIIEDSGTDNNEMAGGNITVTPGENRNTVTGVPGTDGNDGTVSGELGDSVKDLGDGVGNAVDDIGNAVGNAVEGR